MSKKSGEESEEFTAACLSALRKAGSKLTRSRQAIVRTLARAKTPLSVREIFEIAAEDKNSGAPDLVTIYRVLETFLELGLVHQVFPSGGYIACCHQHCGEALHVLTRCSGCGRVEELDVPSETLEPILCYLKDERGFAIAGHLFQLDGTCTACLKKRRTQKTQRRAGT